MYRFFSFGNRSRFPGRADRYIYRESSRRRARIRAREEQKGDGRRKELTGSPLTVQLMLAAGLPGGALQLARTVSPSAYLGFSTRIVTFPSGSSANNARAHTHTNIRALLAVSSFLPLFCVFSFAFGSLPSLWPLRAALAIRVGGGLFFSRAGWCGFCFCGWSLRTARVYYAGREYGV